MLNPSVFLKNLKIFADIVDRFVVGYLPSSMWIIVVYKLVYLKRLWEILSSETNVDTL